MTITVSELALTPVKGTRLQHPQSVEITKRGALDDRRFLVVARTGRIYDAGLGPLNAVQSAWTPDTGLLTLQFPDGRVESDHVTRGPAVAAKVTWDAGRLVDGHQASDRLSAALCEYLGKHVVLIETAEPGTGIDDAAVTIVSDASVRTLAQTMGLAFDGRRFRMTLTITGAAPFEEEEWSGRLIDVGSCRLRVEGSVPRCAVVTHDPATGKHDHPVLRQIAARPQSVGPDGVHVKAPFGVYASVERPGVVAIGHRVQVKSAAR